jgi:hypothetical protein
MVPSRIETRIIIKISVSDIPGKNQLRNIKRKCFFEGKIGVVIQPGDASGNWMPDPSLAGSATDAAIKPTQGSLPSGASEKP